MAVFINYNKRIVVFASYKVAYTTLRFKCSQNSTEYRYLKNLSYPVFKHLIKHFFFKRYLLVRNPYDRFLSLFADKFRKQPDRILNKLHDWEHVHTCLFPYLGLSKNDSDEKIAGVFKKMNISEFVKLLPEVLYLDEHFMPQIETMRFHFLYKFSFSFKVNTYCRLEDELDEFSRFTGIDIGTSKNTSESSKFKKELNKEDILALNKIYKKDFKLGNYTMINH